MQRLQRFKGQIVVTVTVTSEVKGARKAGKCEAPTISEGTMQRIGGGQGLRVRGAAHTEHVWPGWERRATRSPEKNNPFFIIKNNSQEFSGRTTPGAQPRPSIRQRPSSLVRSSEVHTRG